MSFITHHIIHPSIHLISGCILRWGAGPEKNADYSVQFSSVAQSCLTLGDLMDCSTPGLPVHHQLLEFTQTHVHWSRWCHPAIWSSVIPFSSCPQSLPASESFPMSQFFASGDQSIGVSASVLPMNIQDWFPLGFTGFISLQSKGLLTLQYKLVS